MGHSQPAREGLDGLHYDVAIVGGGINGVAIARECALAGRSVLLVEKDDFASGTTSRATRIIHGGLRYLQYGEIGLVRESLRERERLLKERPHLVRPIDFVLAMPTHGAMRGALAVRTALWIYGRAAGDRHAKAKSTAAIESELDRGLKLSVFSYEDAQCEYPERLAAEWLGEAVHAGATVRNYAHVLEIVVREGKARGLRVRDRLSRTEYEISADWVVNASGPWADEVLRQSGIQQEQLIGGVRGSHIVLPPFAGAPNQALYTEAADGRPIFVIPWAGQILIGTTEAVHDGSPDHAEPSSSEIAYLLAAVRRLFPRVAVSASDIRYSYAGVRPLPFSPGKSMASVSRRHILHDHLENGVAGLITLIGGKLTTAASVARTCARMIGVRVPEPQATMVAAGAAAGIENTFTQWSRAVEKLGGLRSESAAAVAEWHGRRALCIARMAGNERLLQQPLCVHSHHIVAEAVEAVQREWAVTLSDILLRRVPVALGACWNEDCSRLAATRIGEVLGWTERRRDSELESFTEERQRFLHPARPAKNISSTQRDLLLV
jgi:glycerol-3-phosphate dehydrogenase